MFSLEMRLHATFRRLAPVALLHPSVTSRDAQKFGVFPLTASTFLDLDAIETIKQALASVTQPPKPV